MPVVLSIYLDKMLSKEKYIKILKWLIDPRANDEALRRKEYLLNVFLLGALIVALVNNVILFYYYLKLGNDFNGASPVLALVFFLILIKLFFLLKRGWVLFVSNFLLLVLWAVALGLMIVSGVENQIALLFWAFVITMGSILIDIKYWGKVFWIMFGSIFLVLVAQLNGWLKPYLGWRMRDLDWENGVAYITVLAIIALSAWLFNKELSKSLEKLKKSQVDLKKERDLLEYRVEQRTQELKKAQIEQISQLAKFVEYGRSMSGLLHDLVNPVTAISLNLKQIDLLKKKKSNVGEIVSYADRALRAAEKMEAFVVASKNKIRDKRDVRRFSVDREIEEVAGLFIYKLKREGIVLKIETEKIFLVGDPAKFDQILGNLISNAIDALKVFKKQMEKKIIIKANIFNKMIQLQVKDNGPGIEEEVREKIFQEFFTTKKENDGVGIGLTIVKHIVEDDFGGSIEVESEVDQGTIFYVTIPNNKIKIDDE